MISRDVEAASRREFDIIVVGGGIYGVSLLHEAARRGMSACLCEARDFGGGTSWNSLRIVHGGLRYLQTLDLRRFFQSVAARRRLIRQFPMLVHPLECLMPLYDQGMKRTSVMRLALTMNDLLSAHRNIGVHRQVRLPRGAILDQKTTRESFPEVRTDGLAGGATWSDAFMLSSERILIELLHDACRHGAAAHNYLRVTDLVLDAGAVVGVQVRDEISGSAHTIGARAVVNCAGPWIEALATNRGDRAGKLFHPSLAFNLLLDRTLVGRYAVAVAAESSDAPVLFVVPQPQSLLAGTWHLPRPPGTIVAEVTETEVAGFLDHLNAAIPGLGANPGHVKRVFAGLLPAAQPDTPMLRKREILWDHSKSGGPRGLYSVSGVKFTTASDVACRTLEMIGNTEVAGVADVALPLSRSTALLTNPLQPRTIDDASLRDTLQQVATEESVQCVDDLVLRRTNWAVIEPDIEELRTRAANLLGLPVDTVWSTSCG